MSATGLHHARRSLARTRETVTIHTGTRDVTVDPATGRHTVTTTGKRDGVPAIIRSHNSNRNVDGNREYTDRHMLVHVEAGTPIAIGQTVTLWDADDEALQGRAGTVVEVLRPSGMFRTFTVQIGQS